METLSFLRVSRSYHFSSKPGSLSLGQLAENMDAIGCIATVISHIYSLSGKEVPSWHSAAHTAIAHAQHLSLARANGIAKLWAKWVPRTDVLPELLAIESFLFDCKRDFSLGK